MLLRHWHGEYTLVRSFWVNLIAPRLLILTCESVYFGLLGASAAIGVVGLTLYSLAVHIGFYIWQLVGLVRACDRYHLSYGSVAVIWAVYFGIIISLIFTGATTFSSYQTVLTGTDAAERRARNA